MGMVLVLLTAFSAEIVMALCIVNMIVSLLYRRVYVYWKLYGTCL